PEARTVGGQHFIDEQHVTIDAAELELRVGDDDALAGGVVRALLVDAQAALTEVPRQVLADDAGHTLERDVFVVLALLGLGGGRKDRLGEFRALFEAGGQLNAANLPGLAIFLPARAG